MTARGRAAEVHLFARAPIPGRTKTRLARAIGDAAAARLHAAFVEDLATKLAAIPDVTLVIAATESHSFFDALAASVAARIEIQDEGDLGVRMAASIRRGLARVERVVIVGSDAPGLPVEHVVRAIETLARAAQVYVPAADGGYVLVGGREVPRFDGVRWSTEHALHDTLACNRGRAVEVLEPSFDVDDAADLARLAEALRTEPSLAPRTAAVLAGLAEASSIDEDESPA